MNDIPEILAALSFFGAIFLSPIVYLLLRHQRAMAELIHRRPDQDTNARIAALEQEVRELRAARHLQIIQEDDVRSLRGAVD